ncbi:MAG: CoA-binding protein [Dehalococcoidales bacterium]
MKVDFAKLDRAFNPKCIVVIGDKGPNFQWSKSQSNFKGKLYSIQIDPKEIEGIEALGVTNFTSLMDVPEPVDLAIVAVPREITPRILEDLIRKDVAAAHFFTAGFGETHTEEGIKLEQRLIDMAEEANFHLIGPNCMGVRNPRAGVGQVVEEIDNSFAGSLGFISQSGMHAGGLIREAQIQGMNTGKSVSYGNGIVLDSTDYLEYFGRDPEISGIGIYLDGVKDGSRFLKVLSDVTTRKPVVIWKGGRTEEGRRASSSHTGSLAVPHDVWEAGIRQSGALNAYRTDELIDTLRAIQYLSPVGGGRVAITGGGGGQSIALADVFSEAGLQVPMLAQEALDEFATFLTLIGASYLNPIDTGNENRAHMPRILEVMEKDTNTDNLVMLMGARAGSGPQFETMLKNLAGIRKRAVKPVMVVLPVTFSSEDVQQAGDTIKKLQKEGIATFVSLERGARALKQALDYYNLKNRVSS